MTTKIKLNYKKKGSKFGIVSRLKNKQRSQFKWKGSGGSRTSINSRRPFIFTPRNFNFKLSEPIKTISLIGNKSPNFMNFFLSKLKKSDQNEYGFQPVELSVDNLQFYLNNKLLNITNKNEIQINSDLLILDTRTFAYEKGGTKYIDVFEGGAGSCKMLSYEESLNNLYLKNAFTKYNKYEQTKSGKIIIESSFNLDLEWIIQIIYDLNTINEDIIFNPGKKCNLDLFLEKKKELNNEKFLHETRIFKKCDLFIDHNKLIIDEFINKIEDGGDGETYIIIGYPDMSMRPYLKVYDENQSEYNDINTKYKNEVNINYTDMNGMLSHIADLYNFINKDKKITKLDDINMFYGKNTYYEKYVCEFYENIVARFTEEYKELQNTHYKNEQLNSNNNNHNKKQKLNMFLNDRFKNEYGGIDYIPNFRENFIKMQKLFYNNLAYDYLNKPMKYIKYIFILFKKSTDSNTETVNVNHKSNGPNIKDNFKDPFKYVPAIFNFRELKKTHQKVIEKIQTHIYKTLPKIYGITTIDDEEYKLFYSTYKYGTYFHIKTEYLHTLSNIFQNSYKYQITITLEEINYMLSLIKEGDTFESLRIDYKISERNKQKTKTHIPLTEINIKTRRYTTKKNNESKIDICDTKSIQLNTNYDTQLINADIKILLLFKETGTFYTCIYKCLEQFYILQFKSNLCELEDILKSLCLKNYDSQNVLFECGFIKKYIINTNGINLFKIIKHELFTINDYKSYLYYNPIFMKHFHQINKKDNFLNINNFFQIPEINMTMPNIYKIKSIFLRNYLGTKLYKTEFLKFKEKIVSGTIEHFFERKSNTKSINIENLDNPKRIFNITDEEKDSEGNIIEGNKGLINKIYFNPGNCKYNFIEIYETINDTYKFIIWVVPLNATDSENHIDDFEEFKSMFTKGEEYPTYIGNFLDLNNTHISMLEQMKKLYLKQNFVCSVNIQSVSPLYYCLHFHVMTDYIYKNYISKNELGLRMFSILHINRILNNIKWNRNYYNSIDMNILTC